jgi:hypothetical protein
MLNRGFSKMVACSVVGGMGLLVSGCGGNSGGGTTPPASSNPSPSITSISPVSATAGGTSFTLAVNGASFISSSTVQWNGSALSTSYVSATLLTANIPTTDIAAAGTANVTISNPSPGGGSSSAVSFTIDNPAPAISSLSPSSSLEGGSPFTLIVNGSGFVPGSTAQWGGTNLATTYQNSSQLTATVPASDIAGAGNISVTVVNAAPGGGTSPTSSFAVDYPVPALASIAPPSTNVGAAASTLTIQGSNFAQGAVVQWNGSSLATTYVSSTSLTALVPASDLSAVGSEAVTVSNPSPGGGISPAISFAINNPLPAISAFVPSSTNAGAPAFTLTVLGTNFVPSTAVQWNGSGRPTSFVSPTQLTVSVTAADVSSAGSAQLTVVNPAPGGGTPSASFIIHNAIPANALYVATNGSDSNLGTIGSPFATIQHCASTALSGGTCAIRGGTYREMVAPNSGVTLTSYYGEPVVIDGSDPLTGWTQYQGSIYRVAATLSSGDTNQVFVNGQMMTEARWPNSNDLFHVNWATAQVGTTPTTVVDSNLPSVNWVGARIHLWSGDDPWDPQTGVITASGTGQVIFTVDGASYPPYIQPEAGGYYYLFGTLSALDTANEWYYDSSKGNLYLWAPGGVNPNALTVTAKQRQWAIDLSGKSNVTIIGIGIFASSINSDANSANNTIDGITARYLSHFTTLPDNPGYPSSYWYDHLIDTGIVINGTGNVLENSSISWSAGNGIALLGSGNTVKNNLIHGVGYMANYVSGISLLGTNQAITGNTIHSTGRFAIFPTPVDTNNVQPDNDEISYNNLYGAMMLSRDGAEIYAGYNTFVSGTQIDHNWIHGGQSLISGAADNFPLSGVYLDFATGFTVDENVLWDNGVSNVFLHGASMSTPLNDDVHNNSIPDGATTGYILLQDITTCGTTSVTNNLVFVPLDYENVTATCSATNNNATAPGATDMSAGVAVGCSLAGCSSGTPPAISGGSVSASIATDPYDITVTAGQPATFIVIANGTPPISYQWLKNGVLINGATSSTFTTPAVSASDNSSTFTVEVSNGIGSTISAPASLTVQ